MRSGSFWGIALVVLFAAGSAAAADLTLSGSGAAEYDSNALRQGDDEDDDFLFRFRPAARIHEDRGQDFRYFLEYALPFEFAAENDELNDVDHDVRGRLAYHPNDRLEIFASETFRYLRGIEVQLAELDDQGAVQINEQRERVTLNLAEVGALYQFTPRLSGSATLGHEFYDSDRKDRAQNWLLSGVGSLEYAVTPRHALGGGVQVNRQEFEATDVLVGSDVTSYRLFASWTWAIDATMNLQVQVGPAYIDTHQEDSLPGGAVDQVPFLPVSGNLAGFLRPDGTEIQAGDLDAIAGPGGAVLIPQAGACPVVDMQEVSRGPLCPLVQSGQAGETAVAVQDPDDLADPIFDSLVTPQLDDEGGQDEGRLNVFGSLLLTKQWTPNLHTGFRYNRTQSGASGLGGAVVEDRVSLSNFWDFADRWNFFVRADWSYRESLVDATGVFFQVDPQTPAGFSNVQLATLVGGPGGLVPIRGQSTEIETMRYGGATRVTHHWTRNTSFWGQLTYNRQESQGGTLGSSSDFDNFLASVGFRHVFEPIKLW